MKKMQLVMAVLLATFVLYQGAAYAKTVSGKMVSTDALANTLTLSQKSVVTGTDENVAVSVKATTTYSGVSALADLKAGDEVSVEAEQDAATNSWIATSVTKAEAPATATTTAAAPTTVQ